jgi:dephospho-CoA kinase
MIIALSGTLVAGKDTVADYLENKKGFRAIGLSDILREMVKERGLEINLENLTKVGNKIGTAMLERALSERRDNENIVFTSIRQPKEIELLKKQKDFFLIFVDADPKIRFERLQSRGRTGDSETFDQFMEIEAKQIDGKSGGMDLGTCKKMADHVIENNGTMEEFGRKIEEVFSKINKKVAQNA